MPRKLRAAAQAAAESIKNVPVLPEGSDEEMVDVPSSQASSPVAETEEPQAESPEKDQDAEPEVESKVEGEPESEAPVEPQAESQAEGQGVDAEAQTPAESKADEGTSVATPGDNVPQLEAGDTPNYGPGRPSVIPKKRRIGRPPKNPRPEDTLDADGHIRVTTPVRRRRGRPAASGGRWARNRGPSHLTQVPVDKEGNMMDVINDEVSIPPTLLVDQDGHLQGGREYRVRTFSILGRGNRLYMLSTEPARCIGFRDSYLFFQKHKMLYKIIIDDDAKRDLIERDLIPHSYKGRAIGVVTARSVFREFGAKIIVGGKKIIDDYDEQAARERGDVEGELAVPEDRIPGPGEEYNRNQYVAWHGASSVYHTNAPTVPLAGGKPVDTKKRRVPVTDDNWMLEHARAASNYNHKLTDMRRTNLKGVYEVHTNTMQYPKIMQPTHVRWEAVPLESDAQTGLATNMSELNIANADSPESTNDLNNDNPTTDPETTTKPATIFPPVPRSVTDRYVVQDIVYESPQYSNMGIPGPDGDLQDIGYNGMVSIANPTNPEFMTPEIIALLPPDCKEALLDAAAAEVEWKSKWGTESENGQRAKPTKSYAWFP
ncbi:hypothetical protein N7444_005100 [Penicillium canescens]|nr:hypothetical protein N7444_005100 [Penicillium canescens]